ncbi:MAG: hypothetical protein AAGE59_31460, partial [Cyanobacteria bacterium P01_F01_bin.86]
MTQRVNNILGPITDSYRDASPLRDIAGKLDAIAPPAAPIVRATHRVHSILGPITDSYRDASPLRDIDGELIAIAPSFPNSEFRIPNSEFPLPSPSTLYPSTPFSTTTLATYLAVLIDTDGDHIDASIDIDDDNDGILDTEEGIEPFLPNITDSAPTFT